MLGFIQLWVTLFGIWFILGFTKSHKHIYNTIADGGQIMSFKLDSY